MSELKPIALIVEDRPEVALLWERQLEPWMMDVRVASTLAQAMEIMQKIPPPDLILLDLNLDDSKAENTIARIAEMKKCNPDVAILVISGVLNPDIIQLARLQGVHGMVDKLSIKKQVDLWDEITSALDAAPAKAKDIFKHTLDIVETFAQR